MATVIVGNGVMVYEWKNIKQLSGPSTSDVWAPWWQCDGGSLMWW